MIFALVAVLLISCNDDGGERDGIYRPLIDNTPVKGAPMIGEPVQSTLVGYSFLDLQKKG